MTSSTRPRLARSTTLALCAAAAIAVLLLTAAAAFAAPYKYEKATSEELSKNVPGEAFQEPWSPTFDAAGNLYLVDTRGNEGKAVVDKFNSENAFQAQLGAGALDNEFTRSVAVNDETGHLYAGAAEVLAEPLFSGVFALSAAGEKLSQWDGANTPQKTFGEGCCFVFTAVDNSQSVSKGDVYVATPQAGGRVEVLEPQSEDKEEGKFLRELEAPLEGFAFEGQGSVSVDQSNGQVYVIDTGHKKLDRYSPTGELEAQIEGPSSSEAFKEPIAVAVDSTTGNVFVIDHGIGHGGVEVVDKLSPTGELLAQITETGETEPLQHPVGLAVQQVGPHAGELYVADAEKKVVDVFAEEQPGAPSVGSVGVQEANEQTAVFVGSVNPHGTATEYRFQYGRCSSTCSTSTYEASIPVPEGALDAEDFASHPIGPLRAENLTPATTYHMRLLAHNAHGEATSEERIFTTVGPVASFALPDARQWELVSPPDKRGATLGPAGEVGVIQAAADGSAISYIASGPTEAQPPGAVEAVQVLSTRSGAGWSSRDIATPHEAAPGDTPGIAPEYRFFSKDLSTSVVQPWGRFNPTLSPEASEQTPYLHTLGTCTSNCFTPLVTGKPGVANVPAGTQFAEEQLCEENNGISEFARTICGPLFEGASPDASHVLLRSHVPLLPGVPPEELYEWTAGHLALVSVLPENEAGEELPAPVGPDGSTWPRLGTQYGIFGGSARRAIAADGTRVFWESEAKLFLRDTAKDKTVQLDAPEPGCPQGTGEGECEGGHAHFQIASADGSRVYFTDERRLTKDAGARTSEPDLYECKIGEVAGGEPACALSDLTPLRGSESANVQGAVLGASKDGSSIYFVADAALAGSGAETGNCANSGLSQAPGSQCNLYLLRDGQPARLVARLSGGDANVWSSRPENQPTRVSPDGRWLAFMSQAELTGYDNHDRVSGTPDAEVFLYDAGGTGSIACASCSPTGARPIGVEFTQLESGESKVLLSPRGLWKGSVAALLPATEAFSSNQADHQPDYLSDSGRLFFNALDPLVNQDTNATGDVYEFEPSGVGSCASASGCVSLISSGESPEASVFIDASESGDDVFFLTTQRLSKADIDARRDIYDAHVCSSASPCPQPSAEVPPPCVTEASCKAPPSPQPSIFGAPSSSTFAGAGNIAPTTPTPPKPRTAAQARAEKLKAALKACKKRHSKHQRVLCARRAKKRYDPPAKAKRRTSAPRITDKRRAR